jgi:hypothetical protein
MGKGLREFTRRGRGLKIWERRVRAPGLQQGPLTVFGDGFEEESTELTEGRDQLGESGGSGGRSSVN